MELAAPVEASIDAAMSPTGRLKAYGITNTQPPALIELRVVTKYCGQYPSFRARMTYG